MALKGKEWLDRMDKLRLDQPQRVIHAIEQGMEEIEKDLIPWAYLIYGSALRQRSRLREAYHAYYDGLQLARVARDLPRQAESTRRMGIVASARGGFRLALEVSKEAISLYLRCKDLSGAGKTLIDQGMYFFHLEEYEESISANDAALAYLNVSEKDHIYTAWQGKALSYRKMNDPTWASICIRQADEIAQELGPVISSKSKWFTGRFYLDLREYVAAEPIFAELLELYLDSGNTIDAVLAGIELARALLGQGQARQATTLAQTLKSQLLNLPDDSIAAAGILEIWKLAAVGRLSLEVLGRVAAAIERERGEPPRPLETL